MLINPFLVGKLEGKACKNCFFALICNPRPQSRNPKPYNKMPPEASASHLQRLKVDFCVLGGGSAGLSLAAMAAGLGASVVLLERRKMGGDCLNYGCIPSKSLIYAAKLAHNLQLAEKLGGPKLFRPFSAEKVFGHVQAVIDGIAPHDSVERFEKLGVQVIEESGSFADRHRVITSSYLIEAKRFVIATGSSPSIPPVPGLSDLHYHTNETIFALDVIPQHLLVLGGGVIGAELAQAFLRLGSEVSLLEAGNFLSNQDPEARDSLKQLLQAEGLKLEEKIGGLQFQKNADEAWPIVANYQNAAGEAKTLAASHLLVAVGRKPTLDNLALEKAGVGFTPKGITVDRHLRTTNRRVFALGDVVGSFPFTHIAAEHASIAIQKSIFKLPAKLNTRAVPWVIYTDPELAAVGLSEQQLQAMNKPYKVCHESFQKNDRAQTEKRTAGFIKALVSPAGEILGVTILGPHAGELLMPWVLAIENRIKLSKLARMVVPYPNYSELSKKVAAGFYKEKLLTKTNQKLVRFLLRFL